MGIFACSLCNEPQYSWDCGDSPGTCSCTHLKTVSLFTMVLWDSWMPSSVMSRTRWSACLSLRYQPLLWYVLSNPSAPQGETGSWGFLTNCKVLCWGDALWWISVSAFLTYFYVGIFCHPMCRGHLTSFWTSHRGNWSTCRYIRFVHRKRKIWEPSIPPSWLCPPQSIF